jgi:glycosyltransferase involved in cell wall biosynthesis
VISNEINRARFMKSYYGLKEVPAVIPTYLPRWWPVPERKMQLRDELLNEAGICYKENAVLVIAGGSYRRDRMSPQLVGAFARLPSNYVLLFNGAGMLEGKSGRMAFEEKVQGLDCRRRVLFRGNVSFEELLELYSAGDVGVLLYPDDGVGHFYQCPGRFTEYLRCGLSLVIPNYPGLELITLKHNLGASCDPELSESIAEALREVGKKVGLESHTRLRALAETKLVYEGSSDLLGQIINGSYEPRRPSVET